jgi:hypothetical protein
VDIGPVGLRGTETMMECIALSSQTVKALVMIIAIVIRQLRDCLSARGTIGRSQ